MERIQTAMCIFTDLRGEKIEIHANILQLYPELLELERLIGQPKFQSCENPECLHYCHSRSVANAARDINLHQAKFVGY
jgi:hypothetical protein